jgi:hypothetical protein
MILKPPDGSKISVTTEGIDPVIVVPHGSASAIRYFVGLFLLFWLGGWFVGFSSTISTLASGKFHLFLVFWLGGWTLAGIAVVLCLYRIFRPSIPESLRLMLQGVRYDSGIPPFQMNSGSMKQNARGGRPAAASVAASARNRYQKPADRRRRRGTARHRAIGERG